MSVGIRIAVHQPGISFGISLSLGLSFSLLTTIDKTTISKRMGIGSIVGKGRHVVVDGRRGVLDGGERSQDGGVGFTLLSCLLDGRLFSSFGGGRGSNGEKSAIGIAVGVGMVGDSRNGVGDRVGVHKGVAY